MVSRKPIDYSDYASLNFDSKYFYISYVNDLKGSVSVNTECSRFVVNGRILEIIRR